MDYVKNSIGYSPVEEKIISGKRIYIKRDDLLSSDFSGNKARKFHYHLSASLPDIKRVVSYGSNQSNAMYSLSVLAKMKGWRFDYYVQHLPSYLEENPHGNFRYALENGMNLKISDFSPQREDIESQEVLFVEEGGREPYAEYGVKLLADEISEWKRENQIDELNIFLPSGTGTTALFLQKSSKDRVFTTPCVGDVEYLKKQFFMLEKDEVFHPMIIRASKKRHFGKLYKESYNIWLELQDKMGIEFDLLYDPHGWLTLLENPKIFEKPLLYIHQGGLIGNESMLMRYKRKFSENI
jgi:1-aminocyclopropane-1-carboxylate deaminase/D-cysteine desulfhydrase-like pyridoxal-dependent ACC family enzyme